MKKYEAGNEWHYLNQRHCAAQGGANWKHLYGFSFNALSRAEQIRYAYIYTQTLLARGCSFGQIERSIAKLRGIS